MWGDNGAINTFAKRPNSYIYRFLPTDPSDLKKGGKLSSRCFASAPGAIFADFFKTADTHPFSRRPRPHSTEKCSTPRGPRFTIPRGWNCSFHHCLAMWLITPFKRRKRPIPAGFNFTEFFFDETGDTDNRTQAGLPTGGSRISIGLNGDRGKFPVYLGDQVHSLDNWGSGTPTNRLRGRRRRHAPYPARARFRLSVRRARELQKAAGLSPVRILVEGRDASATLDSLFGPRFGLHWGFNNEGDNEITGWHLSMATPRSLDWRQDSQPLKGDGACSLLSSMATTSGKFTGRDQERERQRQRQRQW